MTKFAKRPVYIINACCTAQSVALQPSVGYTVNRRVFYRRLNGSNQLTDETVCRHPRQLRERSISRRRSRKVSNKLPAMFDPGSKVVRSVYGQSPIAMDRMKAVRKRFGPSYAYTPNGIGMTLSFESLRELIGPLIHSTILCPLR